MIQREIDHRDPHWCQFCGTDIRMPDHQKYCDEKMAAWKPKGLQWLIENSE